MSQSFSPGTGPASSRGQICGRVPSLFSDKIYPVCHMPSSPQFLLPDVYSSISTGRWWQYLWPYQPPMSTLLSKSWLPGVSEFGPPAISRALWLSPTPPHQLTFTLEAAPLAFQALILWAFDCSIGLVGKVWWPLLPKAAR